MKILVIKVYISIVCHNSKLVYNKTTLKAISVGFSKNSIRISAKLPWKVVRPCQRWACCTDQLRWRSRITSWWKVDWRQILVLWSRSHWSTRARSSQDRDASKRSTDSSARTWCTPHLSPRTKAVKPMKPESLHSRRPSRRTKASLSIEAVSRWFKIWTWQEHIRTSHWQCLKRKSQRRRATTCSKNNQVYHSYHNNKATSKPTQWI